MQLGGSDESKVSTSNDCDDCRCSLPESALLVLDPLAAYLMAKIELNRAKDILALNLS